MKQYTTDEAVEHFITVVWPSLSPTDKLKYKEFKGKVRNGGALTIDRKERVLRENGYTHTTSRPWSAPDLE